MVPDLAIINPAAFRNCLISSKGPQLRIMNKKTTKSVIHLVELLKSAVDNPAIDFIANLTKTETDNKIVKSVREALPFILLRLEIIDNTKGYTSDEIYLNTVKELQNVPVDIRGHKYNAIATELLKESLKINLGDAIRLNQDEYELVAPG